MLHEGVTILSNHCILAYVFPPTVLVAKLSKTTAHRLLHWRTYLEQFRYKIMHIPAGEDCWGDLLLRWRKAGTVAHSLWGIGVGGLTRDRCICQRGRRPCLAVGRRVPQYAIRSTVVAMFTSKWVTRARTNSPCTLCSGAFDAYARGVGGTRGACTVVPVVYPIYQ